MHSDEVIAIPIIFFLVTAIVSIVYITTRHRERMAMVAKGLGSEEIKAMYARNGTHSPLGSLKWGILFVLGGIAIMVGNFLHSMYYVDEGVIVGMVCLFVGIGLVWFYGIAAKKIPQQ